MAEAQTKKPTGSSSASASTRDADDGPYYAWNTFTTEFDDHGIPQTKIVPGDEVTQDDLGVSDEEWDELIETGAVSEEEYPDVPDHISPAEYQTAMEVHGAMQSATDIHQAAIDAALASDDLPMPHAVDSIAVIDEKEEADKPGQAKAASTTSKS